MHTAPPQIISAFPPNSLTAEGQDVVFKCVAQGYPAPMISWQHAGVEVTNDNTDFSVNSTTRQDGLINETTSFFKISSADASMSGEVKCIANPPPPEDIGGRHLDPVEAMTQLTVLGMIKLNMT